MGRGGKGVVEVGPGNWEGVEGKGKQGHSTPHTSCATVASSQPHPSSPHPCLSLVAGVTLRENNLKELEGGHILWSQGVLVANRRALKERPGLLEVVHELIERFEAHLEAGKFYNVLANMRGNSAAEVSHVNGSAGDLSLPAIVHLECADILH